MFMQRTRLAPAFGKEVEVRDQVAGIVRSWQAKGRRVALGQRIISSEGALLVVTNLADELAELDQLRREQGVSRAEAVREAIRWYVRFAELLPVEDGLIGAVSLGEVPKIFATSVMILSPDLTFDTGQRVELRRTASGSQASGGCHGSSLVVLVLRGRSLSWDWSRSTCDQGPTINDRP